MIKRRKVPPGTPTYFLILWGDREGGGGIVLYTWGVDNKDMHTIRKNSTVQFKITKSTTLYIYSSKQKTPAQNSKRVWWQLATLPQITRSVLTLH